MYNYKRYPSNPAQDYFKINQSTTQVKIYDLLGKEVETHTGNFSSEFRYDISHLEPGVYIIAIRTNRGKTTRKLLKL